MSHPSTRRRGQGTLETALAIVIIIPLVFSMLEVMRIYHAHHAVQQAATEGARWAMYRGSNAHEDDQLAPDTDDSYGGDGDLAVRGFILSRFPDLFKPENLRVFLRHPLGTNNPGDPVIVEVRYYVFGLKYLHFTSGCGSNERDDVRLFATETIQGLKRPQE